jgi:hypothetical protein
MPLAKRTAAPRLDWDQHLANLVALAQDFKLCLPVVAANDLAPDQTDEFRDAQAPEVGGVKHQPITLKVGKNGEAATNWTVLATSRRGVNVSAEQKVLAGVRGARRRRRSLWAKQPVLL